MNKEYNELLKSKNVIEFNDQVPMAYRVLSEDKFIKKYGVSHIICDEFQESDILQINLLKLLYDYKYCKSLCVCGDDSQSIFSWRGQIGAILLILIITLTMFKILKWFKISGQQIKFVNLQI